MRAALSVFCLGVGSLLAAWVLPMLMPTLPHWLQIALLVVGLLLVVVGAALGFTGKSRGKTIDQSVTSHNQSGGITARNVSQLDGE